MKRRRSDIILVVCPKSEIFEDACHKFNLPRDRVRLVHRVNDVRGYSPENTMVIFTNLWYTMDPRLIDTIEDRFTKIIELYY